jgi:hypothetical protein
MLYKGGEVSLEITLIISGIDFMERIAEKPSSPQMLSVKTVSAIYSVYHDGGYLKKYNEISI